jgi:hypothetical protein
MKRSKLAVMNPNRVLTFRYSWDLAYLSVSYTSENSWGRFGVRWAMFRYSARLSIKYPPMSVTRIRAVMKCCEKSMKAAVLLRVDKVS